MRIAVLELLSEDARKSWIPSPHDYFVVKQYASIMPQAVSVWCRNLGHDVCYATYFGQKDPLQLIPNDLEVIFISCFSRGCGLAYALAKAIKKISPKTFTIIGGPHARQFPLDALRFFDIVIQECDATLIKEVLNDLPKNQIISSGRRLNRIPSIEERLPEIRIASFWNYKPQRFSFIPILSSTGCPFSCDFCVDWDSAYNPLPLADVEQDLLFAAKYFPQVRINFYDPNFGVQFDKIMSLIENIPHPKKRLKRMKEAGCLCVIPGIESWSDYTNKTGIKNDAGTPQGKLNEIVDHFELIHQYIPIIQANLLFGLDSDCGSEPVQLNKAFIQKTPYVSHSLNIPAPFGGTPLFETYMQTQRILKSLPFTFYCKPYLATTIKHYHPIDFYKKLIEMFSFMTNRKIQLRAVASSKSWIFKSYHPIRMISLKLMTRTMREILNLLKTDPGFRRFHEGQSHILPEYYHYQYETLLGPYKSLISREDRIPHSDKLSVPELAIKKQDHEVPTRSFL